jgi:hypothetical protein
LRNYEGPEEAPTTRNADAFLRQVDGPGRTI